MGQYWMLVNLDQRKVRGGCGKLGEFLFDSGLPIDIEHFITPIWDTSRIDKILVPSAKRPKAKLLQLPTEILSIICKEVTLLEDLIAFCLTTADIFAIALPHIKELHRSSHASWAGDRIICIGDYARDNDYPASIQKLIKDEIKRCNLDRDYECTFMSVVSETYDDVKSWKYTADSDRLYFRYPKYKPHESDAFRALSGARYDSDHPWVLCNLSKKQYIRVQAIRDFIGEGKENRETKKKHNPLIYGNVDLGLALLVRICWSFDYSTSIRGEENRMLHRGSWAGDRFEVTTTDRISLDAEWKDVSQEVIDEIQELWEADYGEDWRNHI